MKCKKFSCNKNVNSDDNIDRIVYFLIPNTNYRSNRSLTVLTDVKTFPSLTGYGNNVYLHLA